MIVVVQTMLCDQHACGGYFRIDEIGLYWVCRHCGRVVR